MTAPVGGGGRPSGGVEPLRHLGQRLLCLRPVPVPRAPAGPLGAGDEREPLVGARHPPQPVDADSARHPRRGRPDWCRRCGCIGRRCRIDPGEGVVAARFGACGPGRPSRGVLEQVLEPGRWPSRWPRRRHRRLVAIDRGGRRGRGQAHHLVDPDLEVAHRQGRPAVLQRLLEVLRGASGVAELLVGAGEEHLEGVVLTVLLSQRLVELLERSRPTLVLRLMSTDWLRFSISTLACSAVAGCTLARVSRRTTRRRRAVLGVAVALVGPPGVDRLVVLPRLLPGGGERLTEGQPGQHPVVERGGERRRCPVVDGPAAGHDGSDADVDELGGEARRQAVVVARVRWGAEPCRPPIAPRWQQLTTTSSGT